MSSHPAAPSEAAIKQRVINHMNTDHQDSLIRYLEHYHHLSSFTARHATLNNITLSSLEIHLPPPFPGLGSPSYFTIPITPNMNSWADARPKVVAMDHEAVVALQRSDVTIKSYVPPYGFMMVVMVACALTFICFANRGNFSPGSLFYSMFKLGSVPQFARFCYAIQPLLMAFMVVLHAGEAWWMITGRLRRHTVPTGSWLWWAWVGSTFIEGTGAFVRFDALVKREEERKAKAKH